MLPDLELGTVFEEDNRDEEGRGEEGRWVLIMLTMHSEAPYGHN